MKCKEKINELKGQYGKINDEYLIGQIKNVIEEVDIDAKSKSEGLCLIGSIICYLAPYLEEDNGYSYFKKALEFDENNYEAIIGISFIFDLYPYPFNTIVTEMEYLSCIQKLVRDFEHLEEKQRSNLLQSVMMYLSYREKMIKKYGYRFMEDSSENKRL